MSFYTPRMSTILRFIFRFLCRFHFHLILLGFTHSFTRRSPSVPTFIRSFVHGNLVFSLLLIHFWLLDSCAVLHNAARYLRNVTFISAHLSGLSSLIVSRVHSSVRSSPHFHSSFWGSLRSQPPIHSSGFLCFYSVWKHLVWACFHFFFLASFSVFVILVSTFSAGTLFFCFIFVCSSCVMNTFRFLSFFIFVVISWWWHLLPPLWNNWGSALNFLSWIVGDCWNLWTILWLYCSALRLRTWYSWAWCESEDVLLWNENVCVGRHSPLWLQRVRCVKSVLGING